MEQLRRTSEVGRVPWAARISSAAAPLLLVGGWTVGAGLQPGQFDSSRRTISDLAAIGTAHRWVMTAALFGLGMAHLVTAAGLRPAAWAGRVTLALGGVATVLVGANPLPAQGRSSSAHSLAASAAFVLLALWPAFAWRREAAGPSVLRLPVCLLATGALLGLTGWLAFVLTAGGPHVGFVERVTAAAEALWPLVVVLAHWRHGAGPRRPSALSRRPPRP